MIWMQRVNSLRLNSSWVVCFKRNCQPHSKEVHMEWTLTQVFRRLFQVKCRAARFVSCHLWGMLIRPCRLIDVDSIIDLGLGCIECLERIIYIHQDAVSTKFMLPSTCSCEMWWIHAFHWGLDGWVCQACLLDNRQLSAETNSQVSTFFSHFSRQEVLVQHASAPLPHGVTLGVLNSESTSNFRRSKWCPGELSWEIATLCSPDFFSPKKMCSIYIYYIYTI